VGTRTVRGTQTNPKTIIIALVTRNLERYSKSGGLENVRLVDISGNIAKILKDVRQMLKEGHTPDEIQAVIDGFKLPLSEEQIALPKAEPTTTAI